MSRAVGPDRRLQFLRARGRRRDCAVRLSIRRSARDRRRRAGRGAGHALRGADRVADPCRGIGAIRITG